MRELALPQRFDLAQTLDCGQAFRWEPGEEPGSWQGMAGGRFLRITQRDGLHILSCSHREYEEFWKNYFDLEGDYEGARARLSQMDPVLAEASAFAWGIRILRQDPWEALCSFIFSQNNNIPRIKGIIDRFCRLLGEETQFGWRFPAPERVAVCTPEDLAPIRCGFRAKYILSAAKRVAEEPDFLPSLSRLPLPEARKKLMEIQGVGPKVAECALLYGCHRLACFPMDVWMKRAMAVLLPQWAPEDFGDDAGLAQQYLFHYSRNHPGLFPDKQTDKKGT